MTQDTPDFSTITQDLSKKECHSYLMIPTGWNPPPCPFAVEKGFFKGEGKAIKQRVMCGCGVVIGQKVVSGKEYIGWWCIENCYLGENSLGNLTQAFAKEAVSAMEEIAMRVRENEENLLMIKKMMLEYG